jgi:hypothetical protein
VGTQFIAGKPAGEAPLSPHHLAHLFLSYFLFIYKNLKNILFPWKEICKKSLEIVFFAPINMYERMYVCMHVCIYIYIYGKLCKLMCRQWDRCGAVSGIRMDMRRRIHVIRRRIHVNGIGVVPWVGYVRWWVGWVEWVEWVEWVGWVGGWHRGYEEEDTCHEEEDTCHMRE